MKTTAVALLLLVICACNNDKSPAAIVKSAESKAAKTPKSRGIVIPVVRFGIEGFYTGAFVAKEYKSDKEIFDNKITICIDSLNETMVFGHSVVAGNDRPFSGTYKKEQDLYSIQAKEPGDNKYDGSFYFTVDRKANHLTGKWESNDKNLSVTEREYDLESRSYKYDPSLPLSEEVISDMVYGTYNEETDKAERITGDVLKKNASTTLLQSKDVENMYKGDLEVLRNSIYARHGYSFKNPRMRTLFDSYVSWYMPVSTDVTALLTDIEKKNIELIKRYEKHATKYYDEFGR